MMKKILFLLEDFKYGGVETSFINLINSLELSNKCEIMLLTWGNDKSLIEKLDKNKIKIIAVNRRWVDFILRKFDNIDKIKMYKNLIVRWLMLQKLKKIEFNTLITFHYPIQGKIFMRFKKNYENIVWVHGSRLENTAAFSTEITNKIDKIVVVCNSFKNDLISFNKDLSNKIYLIENILPEQRIKELSVSNNELFPKNFFNIVTCARPSIEKGIDIAVEACNILKKRIPNLRWFLIGEQPNNTKYLNSVKEKIEKFGLQDNFILLGGKTNPYPYFNQCDLYVQPSLEESFGLTIAEAQICGAVVVSTKTVGGSNLIKDKETGVLCEIDHNDMAETIYKVYNNKSLQNTIRNHLSQNVFEKHNQNVIKSFYQLIEVPEKDE